MAQYYSEKDYPAIRYFIGYIGDKERLITATDGINFVIHMAAIITE